MPPDYETVLFAGYVDAEVEEIRVLMDSWDLTFGAQYPQTCRYIELLDYLRLLLLEYLSQGVVQAVA
jgi:hypothetical protein